MELWRSLGGMLRVRLTSADISAALTALQDASVLLQDVCFEDDLTVTFLLSRTHWKKVKHIAARRGDKVQLLGRIGLYWSVKGLLARPLFLLGLSLLLAVSLYLPTRVLFVRVEGNASLPTKLILEKASQCGICFGTSRSAVRSEKVKNALLEALPQLQWAGVNTSGCVAVITVRERPIEDVHTEDGGISSIVASRDGIIQECTVTQGSAVCRPGQAVRAGQMLISGYTDCGLSIRACRAEGEVYALTERQITLYFPNTYSIRTQEGTQTKKYALLIGKKRINFYKGSGISDAGCVKMYLENYVTLPGGFRLPVALITEIWTDYELEPQSQEITEAEICAIAERCLTEQMYAGRILSGSGTMNTDNGTACYSGRYLCLEMIGVRKNEEIIKPNE